MKNKIIHSFLFKHNNKDPIVESDKCLLKIQRTIGRKFQC